MKKKYTIKELQELGYGRNMLRRLAHDKNDFPEVGHKEGTVYKFDLEKLEKYLERRTKYECN